MVLERLRAIEEKDIPSSEDTEWLIAIARDMYSTLGCSRDTYNSFIAHLALERIEAIK